MKKIRKKLIRLMMPIMERMTPSCDVISQKISRAMDNQVSLKDRVEIRLHTWGCAFCERYRQQLLTIQQFATKLSSEQSVTDNESLLSEKARKKMKQLLKDRSK